VTRPDRDANPAAVEDRERILEPHPELADHICMAEFLRVLPLGQVLMAETAAIVADDPAAIVHRDGGLISGRHVHLIDRVRDDLSHCELDRPLVEDVLDVEVEVVGHGLLLIVL
jgi:hypothetical protein